MGDEQNVANNAFADSAALQPVEWQAPEFIYHEKTTGWYFVLGLISIALAGLMYLIFRDLVTAIVIIIVAIIFGVYGARKPRLLPYRLDDGGIIVGTKVHPYEEVRSFSVKPEGNMVSIIITPLKRFSPYLFLYYSPENEKAIMAVLAARLPYEEPKNDVIDNFMRRIRF